MCIKSCVVFTGPFLNLECCLSCGEPCYKQKELEGSNGLRKVPQQVFTTFPVGPQLQACWKHSQTAKDMFYQWEKTDELLQECTVTGEPPQLFNDIFCGYNYLNLVCDRQINKYDSVLMLSINSAQLYKSKQLDVRKLDWSQLCFSLNFYFSYVLSQFPSMFLLLAYS